MMHTILIGSKFVQDLMIEASLRTLNLRRKYDSDDCSDDPHFIVNSFLIPCLSSCRSYCRITGFFSSSSLAIASQGIATLIKNGGAMRIITSPRLSKDDENAIISGEINEDDLIAQRMTEWITPEFIEDESLEALGWMVAHDKLEVRVVVLTDKDGNVRSSDESYGMFHSKLGIFEDCDGNMISFTGSINESATGWTRNIESFTVFCNWLSEDQFDYNQDNVNEFKKYWNIGSHGKSKTITFPNAVKNKWIQNIIAEKAEDLKIFREPNRYGVRPYQRDAIRNWFSNSNIGLFNMATGTGKTVTALLSLKRVFEQNKKAIVVIVVPFQHLIADPWERTLHDVIPDNIRKLNVIHAFGSSKSWLNEAEQIAWRFDFGMVDNIVYLTTYDTFSREKFISHILKIKNPSNECDRILIADEVHYAGSDEYRNGLLQSYNMRLGLSATPFRYLDDEGSSCIASYFNKVVYDFPLQRAITEINPDTGESYLTPYYYYPVFVTLNSSELKEYNELSSKISKLHNIEELTPEQIKSRNMLLIKRSRILKNAESKLTILKGKISTYESQGLLEHCIIYCSDGHDDEDIRSVESVISCLNMHEIRCHEFTSNENYNERSEILAGFDNGEYKVLVAIKCLDEGVDVPSTKNAFIMASTGNPKEYIQRRGRVLRRSPGKEFANIFDFVIIPNCPYINSNAEIQILISEGKRCAEFAKYSLNKADNYRIMSELFSQHGLRFDYE